jgi:acyl transferase domain-containing protein
VIKLAVDKIDAEEELSAYGIDSVMITTLNQQLTEVFGDISKTLFFEYQTLAQLTGYFCQQYWAQCVQWTGLAQQPAQSNAQAQPHSSQTNQTDMQPQKPVLSDAVASGQRAEIAIIGISGMYPGAATLDDFWHNLKTGTNGISEIPSERWSLDGFYQADVEQAVEQGKSYSKWGGFVSQFSQFDPLFFGIAPREAINIDPQERLFLQTAWQAMENAGYTRTLMRQQVKQRVGVFAGITKTGFNLYGADISLEQEKFYPHTSFSSVANRLSFFLDINGPSMPIDTMCSSSLTAIHEACEHIHRGDCDLAFAGGVNLYLHPSSYIGLCAQQMLSRDGLCKSFGAGGNGFVPGEGVGVALLKPLAAAIADNDHIHGTILATQINHGGKTNGYTVPNPKAQTALIRHTLDKAGISARDVSYIEAHGTGTALGDPIEISGLQQAFAPDSRERGYCKIGSAKSNIGHLEAAAGIAGLSKVLLQMKHRQIAPTLHAQTANPNIDFAKTAFEVNQHLTPWQPLSELGHNMPRIAGVSSFGAGGANAHILVQEYLPVSAQAKGQAAAISDDKVAGKLTVKIVVPLSARTPAQLMQRASDLLDFINQSATQPDLLSVAYTLQTGREAMDHRLVFMVDSMAQLSGQLSAYIDAEQGGENVYQGQVTGNKEALAALSAEQGTNLDPSSLASLWCQGMAVDWLKAIDPLKAADYGSKPQRIPLPGYPFAGKRYWLDSINKVKPAKPPGTQPVTQVVASVLHPLVHTNTSSLRQHSYSSTFSADQWLLADHQVNGQKVLPAVAYLEMAKAAIADAVPELHQSIMVTLHNLVWAQPIIVTDDKQVKIMLFADQRTTEWERINFEIVSTEVLNNVQQETIHCQGQALLSHQCAPIKHDLNLLQQAHQDQSHSIYPTFKRLGTDYGPSYQPITALHTTKGQALAHLDGGDNMKGFGLPPGLMQGALQTSFAVLSSELSADLKNGLSSEKTLPPSLPVAMAMASIKILSPCSSKMVAWARYNQHDGQQRTVLDVDLMDLQGNVCVQMQGISYDLPRPPQMPHPSVAEVAEVQVQKPQQAVPVDLPSSPRKISF